MYPFNPVGSALWSYMISFPGKLSQTCHLVLLPATSSPWLPKIQFNHQSLTDHAQHIQMSNNIASPKLPWSQESPSPHLQPSLVAEGIPCPSSLPFPIVTVASYQLLLFNFNMAIISWVQPLNCMLIICENFGQVGETYRKINKLQCYHDITEARTGCHRHT